MEPVVWKWFVFVVAVIYGAVLVWVHVKIAELPDMILATPLLLLGYAAPNSIRAVIEAFWNRGK